MNDILDTPIKEINHNDIPYVKFNRRLGAYFIDSILLGFVTSVSDKLELSVSSGVVLYLIITVIKNMYSPVLEGKMGATFGKKWLGVVVVNKQFEKISYGQALLRNILTVVFGFSFLCANFLGYYYPYLSIFQPQGDWGLNPVEIVILGIFFLFLFIDIVVYFSTNQKRALHDMIAGTYVVDAKTVNVQY